MTCVRVSPAGCGSPSFVSMQDAVCLVCLNKCSFGTIRISAGFKSDRWFPKKYLYHVRLPLDHLKLENAFFFSVFGTRLRFVQVNVPPLSVLPCLKYSNRIAQTRCLSAVLMAAKEK